MKRLAIIPARGGSKRLPGKNMKLLCGKPLVEHTIDAVVGSRVFDSIIVSTDDAQLLELVSGRTDLTADRRDPNLAGDHVKVIDLVRTIAQRPENRDEYDVIGLFLPTCPFRFASDIIGGLKLLTPDDYSVVCVSEMQDPIQLSLTIDAATSIMNPEALLSPSPLVTGQTRSQDFSSFYRVNGGFYMAWMKQFLAVENFFQGQVKAFVMPQMQSVDIDYAHNFDYAEMLVEKGHIELP